MYRVLSDSIRTFQRADSRHREDEKSPLNTESQTTVSGEKSPQNII